MNEFKACDGLKLLINVCLLCGFLALYMAPTLFVYCIVMVVWSGSVVSLLYEAIYSGVSCARFEERVRESFGAVQLSAANCNC